jgi:hypothetical protein
MTEGHEGLAAGQFARSAEAKARDAAALRSLAGDVLPVFRSDVAGLALPHWKYGDKAVGI